MVVLKNELFSICSLYIILKESLCCCSVAKLCPTLCDPTDCSKPGFPVFQCLLEFAQIHVLWVGDAIQPCHLLPPSSSFAFNLSQHLGLFKWVSSLHQVAKLLKLKLQYQSFQRIFRISSLSRIKLIWKVGTCVHPWRIHVDVWQNQYNIVK